MSLGETIKKKKVWIPTVVITLVVIIVVVVTTVLLVGGDDSSGDITTTTPGPTGTGSTVPGPTGTGSTVPVPTGTGTTGSATTGSATTGTGTTGSTTPSDATGVVAEVLAWFTEDKLFEIAPHLDVTNPANKTTRHCRHNLPCKEGEVFYTYDAFVKAMIKYPSMFKDLDGTDADDAGQKRVLAAYFANVQQETGMGGAPGTALVWVEEAAYNDEGPALSCAYDNGTLSPNKLCYCGRGPLQLTHKANYQAFDASYGGIDTTSSPNLLTEDPALSVASSLFFFSSYQRGPAWPVGISTYLITPRRYKNTKYDFAYSNYLINAMECKGGWDGRGQHRVAAFKTIYQYFSGSAWNDPDSRLECDQLDGSADEMGLLSAPPWDS